MTTGSRTVLFLAALSAKIDNPASDGRCLGVAATVFVVTGVVIAAFPFEI